MDKQLIVFQEPVLTPAKVEWDRQSIMDAVQVIVDEYKDLVFTEDNLKDAKNVCADLNKLKKSIDDEKKRIKKLPP